MNVVSGHDDLLGSIFETSSGLIDFVIIQAELEQVAEFGSDLIKFSAMKLETLKSQPSSSDAKEGSGMEIDPHWIEDVAMPNWEDNVKFVAPAMSLLALYILCEKSLKNLCYSFKDKSSFYEISEGEKFKVKIKNDESKDWPLILIDLYTHEGIVGRSYLEPYLKSAARYIIPALHDLAESQQNQALAPVDSFQTNRRSLNLIGYEGVAMIAVAGLDMAIWDALAKAADLPLAVLLGGTIGPVPAYNSNGLWLADVATLASEASELVSEGSFTGLKLRLGRDRLAGATLSMIRHYTGSKSRSLTTTCRATYNLRSSSIPRCSSERTFTALAIYTRLFAPAPANT